MNKNLTTDMLQQGAGITHYIQSKFISQEIEEQIEEIKYETCEQSKPK